MTAPVDVVRVPQRKRSFLPAHRVRHPAEHKLSGGGVMFIQLFGLDACIQFFPRAIQFADRPGRPW
jgi:hypothetical protein